MEIILKPIGIVHSGFKDPNNMDQHILYETTGEAIIEIYDEYKEGLLNLKKYYNAIFVIYWMHKITKEQRKVLTRYPFNNKKYPLMGVFACGAPVRPNPIGITPCELVDVVDNKIYVRGLDALDGSPVLDIKPYCSYNYIILGSECPEWVRSHHKDNVKARIGVISK